MLVRVRLFAVLRERAGRSSIAVELPDGATVGEALDALATEPGLEDVVGVVPVVMAVNRRYAPEETPLAEGDELALIPPVSGGAQTPNVPRLHVRVAEEPLVLERLARLVIRPEAGAVVTFQGTTRDVDRLEYEAYREMAEEGMLAILADALDRHGLAAVAAEHRVGEVPLGETSVVVSVSAAHRDEAFAGAREVIDRIKAEVPIWKKEVEGAAGERREEWVPGTPPAGDARPRPG